MKIISLFLTLFIVHICGAQSFQLNEDERFAYQVKQVDELIERFNGEEHTLVKEYLSSKSSAVNIDRTMLIKTLFDSQKPNWDIAEVKSFIDYVSNVNKPIFLDFEDDAWYAEAKCSVIHNGKSEKVYLVLKVQKEQNGGLKWVLVSAKSNILNQKNRGDILLTPAINNTNSMNPISHATEFIGLDKALNDTRNIASYIARDTKSDDLMFFVHKLTNKEIKFLQVDSVVYHFLQINGWGFTVQKFRRPIKNSGWLVSSLTRMDQVKKQNYLMSVLNISK